MWAHKGGRAMNIRETPDLALPGPSSLVLAIIGAILAALVSKIVFREILRGRKQIRLPPGPPGEFLLGHYRTAPKDGAFKQYAKWAKEYKSDVLFFETFGTRWIVLNSLKSAVELLEKRGSIYADRPRFVMFEEMGWSPTLTWLRWGPKYHLHRRVLQPPFVKSKVAQYAAMQRREALVCCKGMLDDPLKWVTSVRRFSVAVVLGIAYGLDVDGHSSPWIKLAEDSAEAVGKSGPPGSSIMDLWPSTRYLPEWLPFMERLRYAHTWRSAIQRITKLPFKASVRKMQNATPDRDVFVHNRLAIHAENTQKGLPNDFNIEDIKGAAATILIAGNDTTAATVTLLTLYLMQNPAVQRKAQDEIDRVVGRDRLPSWDDIPQLQYARLVLHETYRMNPLSPLGIPHASVADDVYDGMLIPKGTVVYPNVWAMMHDEAVYARPFCFWPERYLSVEEGGNGEPLPVGNFGFGRRICIGRSLAENSLLIVLATMLATVEIQFPPGPDGKPAAFEPEWSFRGQAIVLPFKTSISSRTDKARELLDAELCALDKDAVTG
ncbi:cytochrome P450 [Cercophora scortea]|uniref:Cytochrome P450 n=1 Tax=Cercophora scortea TaxID=314031 RepID=A0AAE0ING0_9PEZI|nr:cytochrome P450 [Cercophora scortea]